MSDIHNKATDNYSFRRQAWDKFKSDLPALIGLGGIVVIAFLALAAPLLANERPFLFIDDHGVSFPFLRYIFAPDTTETTIEKCFNYFLLLLPLAVFLRLWLKHRIYWLFLGIIAVALLLPFWFTSPRMDRTDWRQEQIERGAFAIYAPIKYGPYSQIGIPYEKPSLQHLLGTDEVGRDVLSRMLYGARVSLSVGLFATGIALVIGTVIGLCAGYFGGWFDLVIMRIVEIILCFPTFLLLLILMAMLKEQKFEQSILLVILVLGLFGWIGLCRLVRGETLKQRALPYISSCEAAGLPVWRIMLVHLLPNVSGVILISFTFGIAGAIISESSLSFLGFGVETPTASWGAMLRQAFSDPFAYWHLLLWPGLALFISVCAFNFTGEGLRRVFSPLDRN